MFINLAHISLIIFSSHLRYVSPTLGITNKTCMRVALKVMQQFFSHLQFILLKLQICHIAT
jgi:hypothetical protein